MAEQKKDKEGPPPLPDDWTRCRAYMEKKHRYCRSDQVNKWGYCGNHKQFCPQVTDDKIRIPCPIDPSHTIYEDQVEKHIKVCPKAVRMKEQEERPYFRRDVNCGGHGSSQGTESPITDRSLKWAQNIALKVLEIHQHLFVEGDQKSAENLTLQDIRDAIPMKDLSQPEMEAGLADAVEHYRIRSGGPHHLHQQASLVGHLRSIAVLPPTPKVSNKHDKIKFLEMGAGRGMLGLVAAGVASASGTSNVHLTLVERSGCRSKADTVLRKSAVWKNQTRDYLQLHALGWSRVQCDLAHIHLPTILTDDDNDSPTVGEKRKQPTGGKEQLVVVAKHLCGAGTDLALKSLRDVDVDACVMATCCHGVCNWNDYVARSFLMQEFGESFGAAEFELLRKWSSGTVASVFGAAADTEHQTPVDDGRDPYGVTAVSSSLNLKCGIQGLGRACQRLLDAGRCEYMRKVLFADGSHDVSLCQYVGAEVTPQNAVLIARRKTLSQAVV